MVAELGPDADELSTLIHRLQGEMQTAAKELHFEEAAMLRDEIAELGAEVRLRTTAAGVRETRDGAEVVLHGGETLVADRVLVCAGLHVDRLARASGRPADPRIIPFRGEYWALRPEREDLVRGLIYPVPDPALPFLGVHLTRTAHGGVLVGPNAVLALAREGYRRRTINGRDLADIAAWPGMRRMARRHWRTGIAEMARSASRRMFVHAARRYVPALRPGDVVPARAGVRAQAIDMTGALLDDFALDRGRHVVWVRNAPSPAATSSLAIAEELVERLTGAGQRTAGPHRLTGAGQRPPVPTG
jgi:(S)-2-hydroxyglutarate dehydrogenase